MFELLNTIDAFVWGPAMIALLLGSHLFFTFKTGFIQRKLPQAIKLSLSSDPEGKGDISHFGALATALAATIGTGSIVGVATAILAGGPGAVFWMWITGVFGIATKYAEVYAAVKYRVRDHNGAMLGGAVGSGIMMALQFGCARGLFSNESGLGSAPIVASAASTRNPAQQSLVAMTGTFWSTVVICALTGIVLVSTMLANPDIASSIMANPTVYSGAMLASEAFAKIPYIGTPILVLGMVAFSYTTILGWSYYGNRCITYLFGRYAIRPYQVIYVAVAFLGAIGVGDIVWTISDIGNALMAIPNIIVVLLLSGMIARETRHYVYDGNLDEADDTPIPQLEGK